MSRRVSSHPFPRVLAAVLAALGLASVAAAGPAVTVYSRDLGFVRETRTIEMRAGDDTVRFEVPERIDFSSVRLVPEGARVRRLAYRFDVASGDGMLDRARGTRVRVSVRGDRVVEGTLIASDGAWIVVRENDGSLHTASRASVDDVRFASAPGSLSLRPTLEAVLDGARRGRTTAELAYLTGGLSWTAEHVVVRRGETAATWSSGVTVENTTGRDFVDAELQLVAGEPARETPPYPVPMMERAMVAQKAGGAAADLGEQTFSEYHLYTLDRPATLRDRESQQLSMLEPRAIQVTPLYRYHGGDPRGVRALIEVKNRTDQGLGVPLPGGRVRFYETDPSGKLQFTGETRISHTAEGEKLTLEMGSAFDLAAERREMANRRISDREREIDVQIELRNRKKVPVTIQVEESLGGDWEVVKKSQDFKRKDANTLQFDVAVGAGKEVVLTYTARVRY